MSAERVIANLLRIAHEDLEGARMLNARGNRNAIYLCEQAAEKIIRAVLTSEKIHAGVRHQLDEMVGPVLTRTHSAAASGASAPQHVRHVVPIHDSDRTDSADPPPAEVEATAQLIEATLIEAAGRFGVDLAAVDKPAATSAPAR